MSGTKRLIVPLGPPLGGKSTICRNAGDFEVESFAEPLYRMIGEMLGSHQLVAEMRERNTKHEPIADAGGKTLRQLLQTLGTEWGRETVYENIWCDRLFRLHGHKKNLAIDDLRFENEYEAALERDALFVRVLPYKTLRRNGWEGHKSESFWRSFPVHCEVRWDTREELIQRASLIGQNWDALHGELKPSTNPIDVSTLL